MPAAWPPAVIVPSRGAGAVGPPLQQRSDLLV